MLTSWRQPATSSPKPKNDYEKHPKETPVTEATVETNETNTSFPAEDQREQYTEGAKYQEDISVSTVPGETPTEEEEEYTEATNPSTESPIEEYRELEEYENC